MRVDYSGTQPQACPRRLCDRGLSPWCRGCARTAQQRCHRPTTALFHSCKTGAMRDARQASLRRAPADSGAFACVRCAQMGVCNHTLPTVDRDLVMCAHRLAVVLTGLTRVTPAERPGASSVRRRQRRRRACSRGCPRVAARANAVHRGTSVLGAPGDCCIARGRSVLCAGHKHRPHTLGHFAEGRRYMLYVTRCAEGSS